MKSKEEKKPFTITIETFQTTFNLVFLSCSTCTSPETWELG